MHDSYRFLPTYSCSSTRRLAIWAALYTALIVGAGAQTLNVRMSDVDFTGLPRVTLKICAERGGDLLRGLDSSNIHLTENGLPRALTVRCPDPSRFNSVVLVLDNSGSMFGVMPKLIEAAGRLVDSLGTNDECAIVSFGRFISMRQGFTSDKALLKSVLASLTAEGGTPLYDASILGIDSLGVRGGNRHAVIITDGEDNQSSSTDLDVVARALQNTVKLYTIAFNISDQNQRIMRDMATATGGLFFTVVRPSELNSVYERIAADITERCCRGEYVADCADTLRALHVRVAAAGDTATDDQIFRSPSRPDTALLAVSVPATLGPFESGIGTITMTPAPAKELALTLGFTLLYDNNLVEVVPRLPFTLGSVAENQVVEMTQIGPGALRFTLNRIMPAASTSLIVGFPIQGLLADTSRQIGFSIVDAHIDGCPVVLVTAADTVNVCQCRHPFAASFDRRILVMEKGLTSVSLLIADGSLETTLPLLGGLELAFPSELRVIGVQPGGIVPMGALTWSIPSPGRLRLDVPAAVIPLRSGGLWATVDFAATIEKDIRNLPLRIEHAALWQRCCPSDTALVPAELFADGYCDKLLQKKDEPSLRVTPHPVLSGEAAAIQVFIPEGMAGSRTAVDLLDMQGRIARRIAEREFPEGESVIAFNADGLARGNYMLVLSCEGRTAARPLVVTQ